MTERPNMGAILAIVLLTGAIPVVAAPALVDVVIDFEAPPYTPNTWLGGQDGWSEAIPALSIGWGKVIATADSGDYTGGYAARGHDGTTATYIGGKCLKAAIYPLQVTADYYAATAMNSAVFIWRDLDDDGAYDRTVDASDETGVQFGIAGTGVFYARLPQFGTSVAGNALTVGHWYRIVTTFVSTDPETGAGTITLSAVDLTDGSTAVSTGFTDRNFTIGDPAEWIGIGMRVDGGGFVDNITLSYPLAGTVIAIR
ncbi:MAG: hypothetical protein JW951_06955 [Lentisphaerae bacterium]|nr:hypothetical protein [Lentisphaerota bacterium]